MLGVSRLGVMSKGVNKCDNLDSMAGDEFSTEPAVYESSLCSEVRSELKRVVES